MTRYACNPYLPLDEYIPDGEPRIFEGRLYVYGSHDLAGGNFFCLGDYTVWSAPLEDLGDWRCEGVSYRRDQDPHNADGKWELFAPDVVQGMDGRYYLFYCLRMQQEFGVAVSDTPAGPFTFYGHIHRPDGSIFDEYMPYDPAVLVDDDGRVFLYYGYTSEVIAAKFGATVSQGCMVIELAPDMLTVLNGPTICLPKQEHTAGTGFEHHGYYEAPSIRKIHGKYYLVYSSEVCHELCYALSDHPTEGFVYGGVIVDNGDIGLAGRSYPVCLPGNNHGGLVRVKDQYYMFYQRHTQCTQYSRQGCAEPVTILPDGSIPQVEVTTSGLAGRPLPARGSWSAAYACCLSHADGRKMLLYREADPAILPAIYEEETSNAAESAARVQFIHNITDGTIIGFKYFDATAITRVLLSLRGNASGRIDVMTEDPLSGTCIGSALTQVATDLWTDVSIPVTFQGVHALYFVYRGQGSLDLKELEFLQ